MHYGRTHLAHGISAAIDVKMHDGLAVPVTSAAERKDEPVICKPPAPRLLWLRRGVAVAANIALAAAIP